MLYRAEEFDPDLGLYYLRARYYNPITGRFMSRDPNDGDITVPASLHKYLYADGDPVNQIDPSGREALEEYRVTLICGGSLSCPAVSGKTVVITAIIFGQIAELLNYALTGEEPPPHVPGKEPNGDGGPGPEPPPVSGPPVAGAP